MSLEVTNEGKEPGRDSMQARRDIEGKLPGACATPGYWATLSENTDFWAQEISVGPIWKSANRELDGWRKEYRREFGGALLSVERLPNFVGKSTARIEEKTYAKIRRAANGDAEAQRLFDQAVPIPRLEDLVRVRLQVQFLDGVPFLAKKIDELLTAHNASPVVEAKGNLNGYFAQHITFRVPVYYRVAGQQHACDVTCEVQIATSLATHVWENSHGLYETTRVNLERSEDWQWSPNDPRFLSRQLGHMIHLADGLFCNLRDQGRSK